MSGGSHDYLYLKIEEMANDSRLKKYEPSVLRQWFSEHLLLVAAACKAIEWVDSCDSAPGSEDPHILKVIKHIAPS